MRFKIFPDEPSSHPARKGSLLCCLYIIPVDREAVGPTWAKRVKVAWSLEAGPGAALSSMPSRQRYSFYELDECSFPDKTEPVMLFSEQRGPSDRSDLFCLRTRQGEVVKFTYSLESIEWVMQTDGSNKVLSAALEDPHPHYQ